MTAGLLARRERASERQGLRPVDPRRDMAAIADVIEASFRHDLEGKSRRMVRDMRAFGRAGWLGWVVGRLFLPPAAYPQGFVWQAGSEVVGNASLLPSYEGSNRWVLANVAVHPEHRRQGIARRLVTACVALAREQGADHVVLQVRSDNEAALALYRDLEFRVLTERTDWVRSIHRESSGNENLHVRRRRRGEWRRQWELAQELFPEGLYWPYPLSRSWFEPAGWERFLSLRRIHHWVVPAETGEFRASLSARHSYDAGGWRLALLVPSQARGQLEIPLLRRGLAELNESGLTVALSYPTGIVDDQLRELGFRDRRTLTWMGRTLEGQGREGAAAS